MDLVIGGRAQGKLQYVLQQRGISQKQIYDGNSDLELTSHDVLVWNHYETWFRAKLAQGKNPEELTWAVLQNNANICVISDEVGNGIVPMDKNEREYRERLGRMLCELAKQAVSVERVICGIGQKIKS